MKLKPLGAAFAAVMTCAPANAAVVIQVEAFATGFTTNLMCRDFTPECINGTPTSQSFSFQTTIADFVNGMSSFTFGPHTGAGISTGTVLELADGERAGIDFRFTRATIGVSATVLSAPTFRVFQLSPGVVPEPATWAMMLVGFGAVGYSMRKRPKVHAQLT
jgi:hypothetical protein